MQLKLEELLRYGFAGAIGLLAFLLCFSGWLDLAKTVPAITQASVLVGVAFAVGTLLYAVHRAFVYQIIYRFVLGVLAAFRVCYFDKRLFLPFVPSPLEVRLDLLRWKRAKDKDYAQPRLAEWGAQIHFLYCSSWAVLLALELGTQILKLAPASYEPGFRRGAWVVVAAAFISNCRLAYYDFLLASRDAPDLAETPNTKTRRNPRPPKATQHDISNHH